MTLVPLSLSLLVWVWDYFPPLYICHSCKSQVTELFLVESAIRGAAAAVNHGGLSVASAAPDAHQSKVPAVDVARAMRKTKKKLQQIEHLVERQKNGKTLNEEGRVKVALKSKLDNQLAKLEAPAAAEQ